MLLSECVETVMPRKILLKFVSTLPLTKRLIAHALIFALSRGKKNLGRKKMPSPFFFLGNQEIH